MDKYTVTISKNAEKQLDSIPVSDVTKILIAIENLANDPRPPGCKKLKGRDAYRIRQGNYRVIYEIFDDILLVDVIAIGHRKDIYD